MTGENESNIEPNMGELENNEKIKSFKTSKTIKIKDLPDFVKEVIPKEYLVEDQDIELITTSKMKLQKQTTEERKQKVRELALKYYYKNKEKIVAQRAEHYHKNIESERERGLQYYYKHKDSISIRNKERYQENKELISQKNKEKYQQKKQQKNNEL
jgi:hypothetical protein